MKNDYRTLRKAILERRDDHAFLKLMANGLGEDVLEELVSDFEKYPDGNYHLIAPFREALDRIQRGNEFKDRMREGLCKRNEPITQLQAWYADKKSGKVVYARKQIQKRFMHLDYADQLKLMRTMLNGGKTERAWCYATLRKWWSDELVGDVEHVWNAHHEERCSWLFSRYMPIDIIRKYVDELSVNSNYYNLCKRLVGEPWFTVDKEKLRQVVDDYKYMWIMSQTKEGLTSEEAQEVVFNRIAYTYKYLVYIRAREKEISMVHMDSSIVNLNRWTSIADELYMCKLPNMDKMFSSMCRMGLWEDVEQFMKFDSFIHDDFLRIEGAVLEPKFSFRTGWVEEYSLEGEEEPWEWLFKFVQYYVKQFPSQYKRLLVCPHSVFGDANGGYFLTGYLADKAAMDGGIMGEPFSESGSDDNLPF